jgi:hypothetical protein
MALNTKPLEVFGGQQWLKFVPVEGVDAITYDSNYAPSAITFNSGYAWTDTYHTMESCAFKEHSLTGILGTGVRQEAALFFPGDDSQLRLDLESMVNQKFVIALNDFEDMVCLVGNKENGCRFEYTFDSKSKVSGLKGTLLSFYREDLRRARRIAHAVLFP